MKDTAQLIRDLKPCPFCGSEKVEMRFYFSSVYVLCKECCVQTGYLANIKLAWETWNRRAK